LGSAGSKAFLPVFSSHPFTGGRADRVTHAVIMVHGLMADADSYFADAMGFVRAAGEVLVIAPWFGNETVGGSFWTGRGNDETAAESVCWSEEGWVTGGDDVNHRIASFAALDALVLQLRSKESLGGRDAIGASFPNLEQITVSGFSAGCQMTTRWAFFSGVLIDERRSVRTQVVAGDCGTYLYLTRDRPTSFCTSLKDTGPKHTCDRFAVPANDTMSRCPTFNNYKIGLSFPDDYYETHSYLRPFAARGSSALQKAIEAFPAKDLRLLLGLQDVCQCNITGFENDPGCYHPGHTCLPSLEAGCCDTWPDSMTSNAVDSFCEAMLTGSNRLQRGLNWLSYLRWFYGSGSGQPVRFDFFQGGHDDKAMGRSDVWQQWALGVSSAAEHTVSAWNIARNDDDPMDEPIYA
jgi:hypothetical protein